MATDKLNFTNSFFFFWPSCFPKQAFQNDVPYEDYFDDLAGEITFYEDLCSQEENGQFDHDAKDAADLSTCGRPLLLSEVQQVREQRPSVMVQELPCFVKQVARGKRHNHSYYRCNAKSPKAKLRCCESALTTINRKSASTNAWLEDLTPDVFWMDNDKTPSSQVLKYTLDCYPKEREDDTVHVGRLQK